MDESEVIGDDSNFWTTGTLLELLVANILLFWFTFSFNVGLSAKDTFVSEFPEEIRSNRSSSVCFEELSISFNFSVYQRVFWKISGSNSAISSWIVLKTKKC
jgi:hypothetical protein